MILVAATIKRNDFYYTENSERNTRIQKLASRTLYIHTKYKGRYLLTNNENENQNYSPISKIQILRQF